MTPKKKQHAEAIERATVKVEQAEGESPDVAMARTFLRPHLNAAHSVRYFNRLARENASISGLVAELAGQCAAVQSGDMRRPESILVAQAHTLDAVFADLAMRAALNMGRLPDAADRYMRLALKAQSQCRATLESLALIKNPPVVIATQANIAHGPQQVNNGASPVLRAREIESQPKELLEAQHGERLDPGAPGEAIRSNPKQSGRGGRGSGQPDRRPLKARSGHRRMLGRAERAKVCECWRDSCAASAVSRWSRLSVPR